MRVRCPACEAGYEIEDALIGPAGRSLRCAACGAVWRVAPPAAAAPDEAPPPESPPAAAPDAAAPDPAPAVETPPDAPLPPARPQPRDAELHAPLPPVPFVEEHEATPPPAAPGATPAGVWIGWGMTLVVLGAAAYAAIHYRAEIMAAWPPSEWIYSALGLRGPPG